MAFAGYAAEQQRRARYRSRGARRARFYILGCIPGASPPRCLLVSSSRRPPVPSRSPLTLRLHLFLSSLPATLPNLLALVFGSSLVTMYLAWRVAGPPRDDDPPSFERGRRASSLADVVSASAYVSPSVVATGDAPSPAFCARPDPMVCAHGTVGAAAWPADAPARRPLPNTVPALAAVVAAGHRCVEVDVSRTRDGHLVALHARELKNLTGGRLTNPGDATLAEILNLPVPGGGYAVATFAEAMATVMHRGLDQITVDFKEGPPHGIAGFAQSALSAIALVDDAGTGCPECVYWGKSDAVALDVLREIPEARVGYTVANFSVAMRNAGLHRVDAARRPVVSSAYVAAVQSEMIEPSTTRAARAAGTRKIYAWTVNDPAKIRRVANHGVDGIVTDEPELATATVRAMRRMCAGGGGSGSGSSSGGGGTEASGTPKRSEGFRAEAERAAGRAERSDASTARSRDDSRTRTRTRTWTRWEGRRTSPGLRRGGES